MKQQINKILQSSFIRNVMVLVSGTAAAQAIALILIPVITRLYGPEIYGLMGSFKAIINIIVPIAALTYPIAIVLPNSDREAKGIMLIAFKISLYLSIISLIILVFFIMKIFFVLIVVEIYNYLYLFILYIIIIILLYIIYYCL